MKFRLLNGYEMPPLLQGVPLLGHYKNQSKEHFKDVILNSIKCGVCGFDTSHDYGRSELMLGKVLHNLYNQGQIRREDVFITTKIGNGQQIEGNIRESVERALQALKTDYVDLMLLHWPYPNKYIVNWKKMEDVYKSGKVKAIGIANVRERHLKALFEKNIEIIPHVVQFEYHPFFSQPSLIRFCKQMGIAIQAYSPLVQMIPLVTDHVVLKRIASQKGKTIPQILLRWVFQNGVAPVFRSYNINHIQETSDIFSFKLSDDEMTCLSDLNMDYKFHPESLNCPGY